MDRTLEQARTLFLEGVAEYGAGRLAQAERKFSAALALAPGRPSVLTNLGAVVLKLGRLEEAVALLQEALRKEPDNAEALAHCGTALAELGQPAEALHCFDRAVAVQPDLPTIWMLRGTALNQLGRFEEAGQSYQEALACGGNEELLRYFLAGLDAGEAPAHAPRGYVEGLFDRYAPSFDTHLVKALRYDAPQVLTRRLAAQGQRWQHALDLGCGTGLCGPHLRGLADRVTGVDLSAGMLEQAARLEAYDTLQQADVVEFLATSTENFDLVVAADVFIYVGALDEVFRLLALRMPAGGAFCFTVEESSGAEVELRASLRYAHSEAGIRRLAAAHGFVLTAMERRAVREEQRQPVGGIFFWLQKS